MVHFRKKYIFAEVNYTPHNKDLLEIFTAYQKWRCYMDGHPNMGFTNNKPLLNLQM